VIWQNPNQEMPSWFNDLPKDKPVIWIYSGNPRYGKVGKVFNSDIMLFACINALTSDDYHVILTSGHHKLPKELSKLPDNFLFTPYVPGLMMAERCDLMIHHGGYGSCQTGLYVATPSLILPTFSERESNARRIAKLGAGECVLPLKDKKNDKYFDIDEIRLKAENILSDPTYVINAKECSRKLKSFGGPVKAADLIEDFIKMRKL
jgi:MGT family glycosyltransferase